jgi:hypothetical protein
MKRPRYIAPCIQIFLSIRAQKLILPFNLLKELVDSIESLICGIFMTIDLILH